MPVVAVLAVLAVLLVATACGVVLARLLARDLSRGERAAWSVALGLAALAAASAVMMALHLVPGPKKLGAAAAALIAVGALARGRARFDPRRPRITPAAALLALAAAAAAASFAAAAVKTGLYGTDALATWMLKARTMFETGAVPARLFSDPALAFSHDAIWRTHCLRHSTQKPNDDTTFTTPYVRAPRFFASRIA